VVVEAVVVEEVSPTETETPALPSSAVVVVPTLTLNPASASPESAETGQVQSPEWPLDVVVVVSVVETETEASPPLTPADADPESASVVETVAVSVVPKST